MFLGYDPGFLGYDPVFLGYDPVFLGYYPVFLGYDPVFLGYDPVFLGYDPVSLGSWFPDVLLLFHSPLSFQLKETIDFSVAPLFCLKLILLQTSKASASRTRRFDSAKGAPNARCV